jgi:hypothetical protein
MFCNFGDTLIIKIVQWGCEGVGIRLIKITPYDFGFDKAEIQ